MILRIWHTIISIARGKVFTLGIQNRTGDRAPSPRKALAQREAAARDTI